MKSDRICSPGALLLTALITLAPGIAARAQDSESWRRPPREVEEILRRDPNYDTLNGLSPDRDHLVIRVQQYFSSLELMSRPRYRLGMLEVDPAANRERTFSQYGTRGLKIYSLKSRSMRRVSLPRAAFLSDLVFSPSGGQLAYLAHLPRRTEVWVTDLSSGETRSLCERPVLATLAVESRRRRSAAVTGSHMLQWTPEGELLTLLVPQERGPEPRAPAIPRSPLIRHTRKKATPTPTYPFLLRTPHDEELFRYYTTAQLALLAPGRPPRPLGPPAMYTSIALSPDGRYILAEKIVEPLSRIVSYRGFPRHLIVMGLDGTILSTVRKIPLQEALLRPGETRPSEDLPREVAWRPDGAGLSLLWREPRQEGLEENGKKPRRDRLMWLEPPFDPTRARTLALSPERFSAVSYSPDGRWAFATLGGPRQGKRRRERMVAYDLSSQPAAEKVLVGGYDPRDVLKLPGQIVTRTTANGVRSALLAGDGESVYLEGRGYREDFRPRPFIDRVRIADGSKERVFESPPDVFEKPLAFLDPDLERFLTSRESLTGFPDSFLRGPDGRLEKLTDNRDPFPEVARCRRIDFEFKRRDGLTAYGRLTLPVGYREGTRVPAVFWTYPREYGSFKEYRRAALRRHNRNRFPHLKYRNASEIWLTRGYAVVEPDIPIVGQGGRYNDNYIAHLVDTMHAAIRRLDRMGYIDVDRLGHGGHSYGAFATANILAHSPFFKAGIAGDGAYNRTLTPMTFQRERRFFWEAADTILEMSPFFWADHLDTPLLMYHGAGDNNTGTFLIQSERMMQALTGLGKTAVLYIYPFESHGPRALETYMDLWARWLAWFDRYVKGKDAPPA